MRILILGAGGHAQVVADILLRMAEEEGDVEAVGYLDDNPALTGQQLLGLPVVGALAELPSTPHDAVIVAIGDNSTRRRMFQRLQAQGERLALACHPAAVIAPDVVVGPGTTVCAGAVINPGSVVGANVILNTGCTVDHHNRGGDHAHLAPGVHTGGEVTIGEGVFVGIGATVIPGRTIGPWSTIGAGSVVTKDIAPGVSAVGMPARVVARRADAADPRGK
jgi:sugar O-acyltransferase (sialic acid O-acetyltransferase NeuD family)